MLTTGRISADDAREMLQRTRIYQYVRVGYDQRKMEFLPNHAIGGGAALLEKAWRLHA